MLHEDLPTEVDAASSDDFGKVLKQTTRSGAAQRWGYDLNGNLARYRDFSGATYSFEYASWNHRVREIDPLGNVVRSEFTKLEELTSVTDGGGTEQRYSYDLRGNVTEVYRHGQLLETYEYDAASNFVMKRDGSGRPLLRFEILPQNLIGTRHLASGDIHRFEYDDAGRIIRAVSGAANVAFAYDHAGRRIKTCGMDAALSTTTEMITSNAFFLSASRFVIRKPTTGYCEFRIVPAQPTGSLFKMRTSLFANKLMDLRKLHGLTAPDAYMQSSHFARNTFGRGFEDTNGQRMEICWGSKIVGSVPHRGGTIARIACKRQLYRTEATRLSRMTPAEIF
jgi:YD repeat-containing protein